MNFRNFLESNDQILLVRQGIQSKRKDDRVFNDEVILNLLKSTPNVLWTRWMLVKN